jgi:hypothetical protein
MNHDKSTKKKSFEDKSKRQCIGRACDDLAIDLGRRLDFLLDDPFVRSQAWFIHRIDATCK